MACSAAAVARPRYGKTAPRRGIVFQYRADGVWKDTGIMIFGHRREHVRCDAGVLRLPKSRRYPEHPFGHAWH